MFLKIVSTSNVLALSIGVSINLLLLITLLWIEENPNTHYHTPTQDEELVQYVSGAKSYENKGTPNVSISYSQVRYQFCTSTLSRIKFSGPQPCPERKDVLGYSDIDTLNNDMLFVARSLASNSNCAEPAQYEYHLCPETVFEMDDFASPLIPTHDNAVIKCGEDGSSENTCILSGGVNHIYFNKQMTTKGVEFHGITFANGHGQSVLARSSSVSYASFFDCHWVGNEGGATIDILYKHEGDGIEELKKQDESYHLSVYEIVNMCPHFDLLHSIHNVALTDRAMRMYFDSCTFTENKGVGVITNAAGEVEIVRGEFSYNKGNGATIGVASGGKLFMKQTSFLRNRNHFSTVFIDRESQYDFSYDAFTYEFGVKGIRNGGETCSDIYFEYEGSDCLERGDNEHCNGLCCGFSDENCYSKDDYEAFVNRFLVN